jgi:hypothetical protein
MRLFVVIVLSVAFFVVLTGLIPQLENVQATAVAAFSTIAPSQTTTSNKDQPPASPELTGFSRSLINGNSFQVVGIYTPGLFSLPVIQQPVGESAFVSTEDNSVTQFALTDQYHSIGLLAHNYLSGSLFFDLKVGETIFVVYGDGHTSSYRISAVEKYQALDSTNPYSDFVNLDDPSRQVVSSSDLFEHVYTSPDRLIFQTCIDQDGDPSWGRLFVTANKLDSFQAKQPGLLNIFNN